MLPELDIGDTLTVCEFNDDGDLAILIDENNQRWELHTSPCYAEVFEQLYTELLHCYSSLEFRRGLKDRVDLVTRDERVAMKKVLDLAAAFR